MDRQKYKFLQQQGYKDLHDGMEIRRYDALQFQPRIVGSMMLIGILLQSPWVFLLVSAILWINVVWPVGNLFEIFYNRFVATPKGNTGIPPAPPPRRFAQGMAAVFMLIAGISLLTGRMTVAYIFEALIAVAFSALIFGKFCLGAYIFQLLKGRISFANATCPWSQSP